MTESVIGGPCVIVGRRYRWHGKTVQIISGQFWGTHGLSNWWRWREVKDGKLVGRVYSGYGDADEFEAVSRTA